MNILFRANSSSIIGTGHIMRDLVLAKELERKYKNTNISFAVEDLVGNINQKIIESGYKINVLKSNDREELVKIINILSIDLLVIDSYDINYKYEKFIKETLHIKILILDDTYEKHYCDILLNHNIYADEKRYKNLVPSECKLWCGEKYTLIRDEFKDVKYKFVKQNYTTTLFVAMGGTDVLNFNPKIIKVLERFENIKVYIVTTSANTHLEELREYVKDLKWVELHINSNEISKLMMQSDLAIVTPSVTMNEVWYMNLRFISIKVADNQVYMCDFLKSKKKNVMLEFNSKILYELLKKNLDYGCKLINFIDLPLEKKEDVLEWRNNKDIKKWMYNKELITLENHLKYIESLKNRIDRKYFLLKQNNIDIGVIDFTSINNAIQSAEIGLYIKPNLKGYGSLLMKNILRYGFYILGLKKLYSNVYIKNNKAIKLYEKFGFIETKRDDKLIYLELNNENRKL